MAYVMRMGKGCDMDAVIVLLAMGLLIGLSFGVGLPYWGWLWISIALVVATFEIVAKVRTGKTLSQQFGAFLRQRRWLGLLVLGIYAVAFLGLILHLYAMR